MRVTAVTFHRFKKYRDKRIDIRPGVSLLAGANNSGKSTLLHGLAIWEYCKTVIEMEKGRQAFLPGSRVQGIGVGADEFTPIGIPSLRHLWTNLKSQKNDEADGYSLWIDVEWHNDDSTRCHLKIGLSLANDRLFIKTLDSNIDVSTPMPRIAHVTPFAGIQAQEPRYTPAQIRRYIGQGLPGSVLRNILLDLKLTNDQKRTRAKEGRQKLKSSFLRELRETDPFERLKTYLEQVFSYGIDVKDFNDYYHTVIRVETFLGHERRNRFVPVPNYNRRDLMVEGSGFLQWLTVLSLALDPGTTTLVLDEPDAHLHSRLQQELLFEFEELYEAYGKQILFATHSPDLIKAMPLGNVMRVEKTPKYLSEESQRTAVLHGIGSEYAPRLHKAQTHRRVLFVENQSDAEILRIVGRTLDKPLPDNLAIWPVASRHSERVHVFQELSKEIPDLRCVSIVDRDTNHIHTVDQRLIDQQTTAPAAFRALTWRRRNIESYLLVPAAIARAGNINRGEVERHLSEVFSLSANGVWPGQSEPQPLLDTDGKSAFETPGYGLLAAFGTDKYAVAKALHPSEIADDLSIALVHIRAMCE
jgi:predicted ATPase